MEKYLCGLCYAPLNFTVYPDLGIYIDPCVVCSFTQEDIDKAEAEGYEDGYDEGYAECKLKGETE